MRKPRPEKPSSDFNPQSSDSMFAKIIERLSQQDRATELKHRENKEVLENILAQTTATNGRVTRLEENRKYALGWIAGVSFFAMILWALFVHFTKH